MSWQDILKAPIYPNPYPANRKRIAEESYKDKYPRENMNEQQVRRWFSEKIDPKIEEAMKRNKGTVSIPLSEFNGMHKDTLLKWVKKMYPQKSWRRPGGYNYISINPNGPTLQIEMTGETYARW